MVSFFEQPTPVRGREVVLSLFYSGLLLAETSKGQGYLQCLQTSQK